MIPSGTPEHSGFSSRRIAAFLNRLAAEHYNLHSLQICRNGQPVYTFAVSPFTLQSPHRLFSAAKAIISLSVLFAIQEGKLCFEDRILDYFPEYAPASPSSNLSALTVYDLMTMQTGMETDPFVQFLRDDSLDLVKLFFETPVVSRPGTGFRYNNSVPHILYRLTERATGTIFETFQQTHICEPLNAPIVAEHDRLGFYNPLTIVMSNDALLNIGRFYTQEGSWNGIQLLDRQLVRYATCFHIPTRKNQSMWGEESGYGMQVMRNSYGGFRLPGGFGQFAICLPDDGITVSVMSADERMNCVPDAFREEIYASVQLRPLPEDPEGEQFLRAAEQNIGLAPKSSSLIGTHFPPKGTFSFSANTLGLERLTLSPCGQDLLLTASVHGKPQQSICGLHGHWSKNRGRLFIDPNRSIQQAIYSVDPDLCFASGAWQDETTFDFVQQSPAEMGHSLCRLSFADEKLMVYWPKPVSMGYATLDDCTILTSERRKTDE